MRLYDELKVKNLKLLSKIQQLRGNIQVCCRVRPPSEAETQAGGQLCVDASDESNVYVYDAETAEWALFEVDAVWGYDHSQADVFADVEPLVGAVADGRSACIMAYGDALAGTQRMSCMFSLALSSHMPCFLLQASPSR
jgi:kinesin family protein C1